MELIFDLTTCYSPDDVHSLLKDSLPLPDHYGGNLDALYDVLTEPHEKWDMTFTGIKAASAVIGQKFIRQFKRVLENAEKDGGNLCAKFLD